MADFFEPRNPSNMPATNLLSDAARLDAAADQAIAACGGDVREAVKTLLIANEFLENELATQVSQGLHARCQARGVSIGDQETDGPRQD